MRWRFRQRECSQRFPPRILQSDINPIRFNTRVCIRQLYSNHENLGSVQFSHVNCSVPSISYKYPVKKHLIQNETTVIFLTHYESFYGFLLSKARAIHFSETFSKQSISFFFLNHSVGNHNLSIELKGGLWAACARGSPFDINFQQLVTILVE